MGQGWHRSVEHHNNRYKRMVSDQESMAFNTVKGTHPDYKVVKLDCVRSCPEMNEQARSKFEGKN